jgi:hypothetical protein
MRNAEVCYDTHIFTSIFRYLYRNLQKYISVKYYIVNTSGNVGIHILKHFIMASNIKDHISYVICFNLLMCIRNVLNPSSHLLLYSKHSFNNFSIN